MGDGFVFVMGHCLICKQPFSFNPNRVPSIRVDGEKEPICQPCYEWAQAKRKEEGVPAWPDPAPDAWDAMPVEELDGWGR